MAEHMLSIHETLEGIPSTHKRKRKRPTKTTNVEQILKTRKECKGVPCL